MTGALAVRIERVDLYAEPAHHLDHVDELQSSQVGDVEDADALVADTAAVDDR